MTSPNQAFDQWIRDYDELGNLFTKKSELMRQAFHAGFAAHKASVPQDAQTQWQGMDSVPRDGTWILIESKTDGVCIVKWHDGEWDFGYEGYSRPAANTKRWMPLPSI